MRMELLKARPGLFDGKTADRSKPWVCADLHDCVFALPVFLKVLQI